MENLTQAIRVVNSGGLHARPSAGVVKKVENFNVTGVVRNDVMEVGANSIMGLMMLGAEYNDQIEFSFAGPDAIECMNEVQWLFYNAWFEMDLWKRVEKLFGFGNVPDIRAVYLVLCEYEDLIRIYLRDIQTRDASELSEIICEEIKKPRFLSYHQEVDNSMVEVLDEQHELISSKNKSNEFKTVKYRNVKIIWLQKNIELFLKKNST
ncbi:MAG: HPr family phosphocarrier protein [Hyphomicrobiales bacterium]